jgi:hypothetical protein
MMSLNTSWIARLAPSRFDRLVGIDRLDHDESRLAQMCAHGHPQDDLILDHQNRTLCRPCRPLGNG